MSAKLSSDKHYLVLKNQGLIRYLVVDRLGISPSSSEFDDLISIGQIGLIKAAITFDSSKGNTFATYASRCIINEIFMHHRKEKRSGYTLSIDDPIVTNVEGNELTLGDMLEDPDSSFVETIENNEQYISLISIVLNCLEGRRRLALLYRMGKMSQSECANKLNMSQSYVSRMIQEAVRKVKEIASWQVDFNEVFSVEIVGDEYRISFSSKEVSNFNKNFGLLSQNLTSMEKLPDFKINSTEERTTVQLPAYSPDSFSFIADIIQEIDNFNMSLFSKKAPCTNVQKPETTLQKDQDTGTVAVVSQNQQIRDYMLSMTFFTVNDLRLHFPNFTVANIRYAIHLAKAKGLITNIGRGIYIVNKT